MRDGRLLGQNREVNGDSRSAGESRGDHSKQNNLATPDFNSILQTVHTNSTMQANLDLIVAILAFHVAVSRMFCSRATADLQVVAYFFEDNISVPAVAIATSIMFFLVVIAIFTSDEVKSLSSACSRCSHKPQAPTTTTAITAAADHQDPHQRRRRQVMPQETKPVTPKSNATAATADEERPRRQNRP